MNELLELLEEIRLDNKKKSSGLHDKQKNLEP